MGVDIFFIISGYFMINSTMKIRKFLHVVYMCVFYNIAICILMNLLGYTYPLKYYFYLVPFLFDMDTSFVSNYLLIYLISPIINAGLNNITRKQFHLLLGTLFFYYVVQESFLFQNSFQYFGWGITCYAIGAYIRKYDIAQMNVFRYSGVYFIAFYVLVFGLMLLVDYVPLFARIFSNPGFFITNAHKFTVIVPATLLFIAFARMNIGYHSVINKIASTSLAVLLIHANNRIQVDWLWYKLCNIEQFITTDYFILHMVFVCVLVYMVCVLIDLTRSKLLKF